jgi:hypothetical protein
MTKSVKQSTKQLPKHNKNKTRKKYIFSDEHYNSNDGMLTRVWGPSMWHVLHTMSFNYPLKPTCAQKTHYMNFVLSLQDVLPCGKCRTNLEKNFKKLPLKLKNMESRHTFSLYIYKLHEVINKMLHKKSGLSFEDVRERYEHFRARCKKETEDLVKSFNSFNKNNSFNKENGCTEPINGQKAKCILKIVPDETKCETFQTLNM